MIVIILLPLLSQIFEVFSSCFVPSLAQAVSLCHEVSCGFLRHFITIPSSPCLHSGDCQSERFS